MNLDLYLKFQQGSRRIREKDWPRTYRALLMLTMRPNLPEDKPNPLGGQNRFDIKIEMPRAASMLLLTLQALVIGLFVFSPILASAIDVGSGFDTILSDSADQPWELEADEVSYDHTLQQYIASGNVVITKADKIITADYIRFDHKTMEAYAEGNVVFVSGLDRLSGSSMEIDLDEKTGTLADGAIFLKESNYYFKGAKIQKVGEKEYTVKNGTFTTCDGDKPAWRITGKDVKIKADGSGSAKHAKFYARNIPVLYTPYLYYPARKDRQTGFLIPQFGYSDRLGGFFTQPFFWAINKSSDATFYAENMSFRGQKLGAEYRYFLSETTKGAVMLDGFKDKRQDNGDPDSSDRWGFEDDPINYARPNKDRWWFRMSHHQEIPWGFKAKLDLDVVSDQDYLREFRQGFMGFNESNKYFNKYFSRQLDDFNDPVRVNRLLLNKSWSKSSFNAELRWYDDVIKRRLEDENDTIQKLPFVNFVANKQQISSSPFFFLLGSKYEYLWREDGPRTHRIDVHPRLLLPLRLKSYLSFEPSVGLRETAWRLDKSEDDPSDDGQQYFHRELFDARLDLFSEVYSVFKPDWGRLERIKHTIRPRVIYDYTSDPDQSDLPNFDSTDRVANENLITYSLTNSLTSKTRKANLKRPRGERYISRGGDVESASNYNYNDFFWFKLEQMYDIDEATTDKSNDQDRRPFSPLATTLQIYPGQFIAIDNESKWSVYKNEFLSHNIAASLWDKRGDKFFIEHRYNRGSDEVGMDAERNQSIYSEIWLQTTAKLMLFANYERNIEEDMTLQTSFGFSYKSQCWSMDFRYTDRNDDEKFEFKINLTGLGGLGI